MALGVRRLTRAGHRSSRTRATAHASGGTRNDSCGPVIGGASGRTVLSQGMSTPVGPGRDRPLVGRTAELDDLDDLLSVVAGGDGATVLIEGERGVGKSSLVRALRGGAQLLDLDLCVTRADATDRRPFAMLTGAVLGPPPRVRTGAPSDGSLPLDDLAYLIPFARAALTA